VEPRRAAEIIAQIQGVIRSSISIKSKRGENMPDPTIQVLPKGPYLITGKFALTEASGNKIEAGEKIALCRCGASTNKPFCDGTHSKVGFDAAAAAVPSSAE
jgi:CDGSH-type Zn-finger protein